MLEQFWDKTNGGFFMTRVDGQITAMSRPKDSGGDGATPSGNSVALRVLQMLVGRSDNLTYEKHANAVLAAFADIIGSRPSGFGYMLTAAADLKYGELAVRRYAARGGVVATASVGEDGVSVELRIPDRWHINSNKPLQDGLIATTLRVGDSASGWRLGAVSYPEAEVQKLGFQRDPLALYHGTVRIRAELLRSGETGRMLPLELSLQACNDQVCLPPEKVVLRVPVTADPSGQ